MDRKVRAVTDDLRAFVAARLDEDEAAARAATEGPWSFAGYDSADGWPIVANDEHEIVSRSGSDDAEHIARHDPARVLREVTAKRAILAVHQIKPPTWREPDDQAFGCECCHFDRDEGIYGFGYCPTLKALAAVYSDHEDFRGEWAA